MKKTKIIVPALAMLVLSTAASVTGTVAWFSANTSVNVSGMAVTTKVTGNILIATDNTSDANYTAADLSQSKTGLLEPVSAIDATNFFWTKEVTGDGQIASGKVFNSYDANTFATSYGVENAIGYIDYTFYLKATAESANSYIYISNLNLLYNNAALANNDYAWRVGMFAKTAVENTNASGVVAGDLVSILKHSSANYFTGGAVKTAGTPAQGEDAYVAPTFETPAKLGEKALIGSIQNKGATQRFYVVVRLWLEGNDTSCTNDTFAALDQSYTLSLTCALSTTNSGVTSIGSVAA